SEAAIRTGACSTSINVTSESGRQTLFKRAFKWQVERTPKTWTDAASAAQAITLDIAYYPDHNKLKSRIDVSGLSVRDAVKGVILEVKPKAGAAAVAQAAFPALKENQSEIVVDVPDLPDGTYLVEAKLQ